MKLKYAIKKFRIIFNSSKMFVLQVILSSRENIDKTYAYDNLQFFTGTGLPISERKDNIITLKSMNKLNSN